MRGIPRLEPDDPSLLQIQAFRFDAGERRQDRGELRLVPDEGDRARAVRALPQRLEQVRHLEPGIQLLEDGDLAMLRLAREDFGRLHGAHQGAGEDEVELAAEARERLRRLVEAPPTFPGERPEGVGALAFAVDGHAVSHQKDLHVAPPGQLGGRTIAPGEQRSCHNPGKSNGRAHLAERLGLGCLRLGRAPVCAPENALGRAARSLFAVVLLLPAAAARSAAADGAQLLDYLNQAVGWYRGIVSMAPLATDPAEVQSYNDARTRALEALRLAFEFAHADAALLPAAATAQEGRAVAGAMNLQTLKRLASDAQRRANEAQAEVDRLQAQVGAARSARLRRTLERQLAEAKSELRLAQARKDTVDALSSFTARVEGGGATLLEQIDALERSVPELRAPTPGAAPPPTVAASSARGSSDRGVLPLTADLFSLVRKQREIRDAAASTAALREKVDGLRTPLTADLRSTLQQGDELSQAAQSTDRAVLEDRTRRLEETTAHFKKVSAALLPLGKQTVLLDEVSGHLEQWDKLVDRQTGVDFRGLILRLALVALGIAVLLAGSELWRRATFKYIQDSRRRQQLLLLRRIVVIAAVVGFVVFALVNELSSIATFAGFITAGLAIALQNVILSVVAYFFLIGKYGVRVGDRVQISGISGDVIDLGLIRLHLMEVGPDGQQTGRVVVFSNAVLFQPTANFFKQLPGSNFTWHQIQLTLSPGSDYRLAEARVLGSVEAVFAKYRDSMEAQHQRLSQDLFVPMSHLLPHSRLRLSDAGLEMTIRYPVPLDRAAVVDDEVTRSVLDAISRQPRLELAGLGAAVIQTTTDTGQGAEPH